jgi:hypothetical protein
VPSLKNFDSFSKHRVFIDSAPDVLRHRALVKVSTMRGFQDSTLKVFCELGDALATRINEFGDGLRQIFVVRIQSVAPQYSMRSGVAVGDAGCQREVLSI